MVRAAVDGPAMTGIAEAVAVAAAVEARIAQDGLTGVAVDAARTAGETVRIGTTRAAGEVVEAGMTRIAGEAGRVGLARAGVSGAAELMTTGPRLTRAAAEAGSIGATGTGAARGLTGRAPGARPAREAARWNGARTSGACGSHWGAIDLRASTVAPAPAPAAPSTLSRW